MGKPLKEWDIQINYGIKTGFNEAFIIDGSTKDTLIAEDPKSVEIIRPILRGKDIKKYKAEFADLYLIYAPWHFPLHNDTTIQGASLKAEQAFREDFPAIYQHLSKYKRQLSARNKAETGIRYEWYALQRWGANYWEEFEKEKIIFQEIVQEPCFILDEEDKYFCLDTARVITGENLKYLLCVFNSNLFFYAVKQFYGGGGLGATGVRMKHTFFENFSLPKLSAVENNTWINLANQILESKQMNTPTLLIENEINRLVYDIYGLTEKEIELIVKSI